MEEEKRLEKEELEKQLAPLWLVNFLAAKLKGEEVMSYEDFHNMVFDEEKPVKSKSQRSGEEIINEFMPLVEADRQKGG